MRRALVDMWLGSERRQPEQDVDRAEDRDDALCRLVREGLNGLVSEALDQAGRDPAVAVLHLLLKHVHARQQVTYGVRIADACDRVFSSRCIVQSMLTIASRLDVMNRLGRALADPTRSRIILTLLDHPAYPAELARDLDLTRPNVSNHLACLRDCGIVVSEPEGRRTRYEIADSHLAQALTALVDATLAVDEDAPCIDPACSLPGCDAAGEGA